MYGNSDFTFRDFVALGVAVMYGDIIASYTIVYLLLCCVELDFSHAAMLLSATSLVLERHEGMLDRTVKYCSYS